MIFRQLFDPMSSTYTYLLGCEREGEAVLIDSVYEQFDRDAALIRELDLDLKYVLDTHVHADHVTGAWRFKEQLGARICLSHVYGADNVDIAINDGDLFGFGEHSLMALETPGHTGGCLTYITTDRKMAFTGDCLLIRGAGRTDFQSGDVHAMWHSIREKIFTLPDECLLYPAHDYQGRTVSTVAEERRLNPRIGGDAREEDFVGYMDNLGLPHPKLLELAVPANMKSGRPENETALHEITWAPVTRTFAGVPEVRPDWVARNMDAVTIVDVRTSEEFAGDLGRLKGSLLIPINELRNRLEEIPKDKPVVLVCQSGKRSAMATQILLNAGFDDVANVPGGLIHWMRMALPFRQTDS